MLVVFGANKFSHFIPIEMPTGSAGDFMNYLNANGYIFPVVGILEVVIGIMLLLKKCAAFALILLAPIAVNILLFHLFLDIPGVAIALLVTVFNGILIYKQSHQYKPLFY